MTMSLSPKKLWTIIQNETRAAQKKESVLKRFFDELIQSPVDLAAGLTALLSWKLSDAFLPTSALKKIIAKILKQTPSLIEATARDLKAVCDRDPAARDYHRPFLYFKGFHALQVYRLSHWLWQHSQTELALYFQSRSSQLFGVDIHPAAKIGAGILIDHATSVVIGETAVVEDDVSILHEVTLGGTGKETGDRHPKIRRGVLIGAGAKILGNIEVGEGAKVAAGSVVLKPVAPHSTVAGVPAKVVGKTNEPQPSLAMVQEW